MGQLVKASLFDMQEQNAAAYFRKAVTACALAGKLATARQDILQDELWALLARQTAIYTAGDSSSVPIEIAQNLLGSLYWTLGTQLKSESEDEQVRILQESTAHAWLARGQDYITQQLAQAKHLLEVVQSFGLPSDNIAYQDTVFHALPQFFRRYDRLFFAQEIPCLIDYPLCVPVPDAVEGVTYIRAYLTRLRAEALFCACFPPARQNALLWGCCPDPTEMLVNLFEPVLQNALGLTLLGCDPLALEITAQQQGALCSLLAEDSPRVIALRLALAVETLTRRFSLDRAANYLCTATQAFAPRLARQVRRRDLSALFIEFPVDFGG